jgi:ML domain
MLLSYEDENVTNGSANLLLKFDGFITVLKKTYDICATSEVTCPIAAGDYSQSVTEAIPSNAPSVCSHSLQCAQFTSYVALVKQFNC